MLMNRSQPSATHRISGPRPQASDHSPAPRAPNAVSRLTVRRTIRLCRSTSRANAIMAGPASGEWTYTGGSRGLPERARLLPWTRDEMGHLPTGIVTFLFTDIEGHTRLL